MGDTCDITLPGSLETFHAHASAVVVGNALLTEMRSVSLNYSRRARHIASSGYSHFQINVNLAGHSVFHAGRRNVVLRPGDVTILDTTHPVETFVQARAGGHARSLALFLPRETLAPQLPHSSSAHCALISGSTPGGRLLYDQMIALLARAQTASVSFLESTVNQIAELVASEMAARPASPAAMLHSIKQYLDANLDSRDLLSSDVLCRRFECSRSTLYRLFESEGGLVNYVQQRRLQHALIELISPGHQRRIIDIAAQNDFASEATFNRAFRRLFGIPPSEARELSESTHSGEKKDSSLLTVQWLKELGKPLSPATHPVG